MNKTLRLAGAAFAVFLASSVPLAAADGIRTETVHFKPGTSGATIKGRIKGYESVSYLLGASAGQVMRVSLSTRHGATYFNVYGPGKGPGDDAIANSQMTDVMNSFEGVLPANGQYTISVYMMRSAARRNEVANYTIDVSIDGRGAATHLPARPGADAPVAGTDFNATGQIPCARYAGQPMNQCDFGVTREGNGNGMITVFWPDGGNRVIFFEMNTPTSFDQSQADGNAQMTVGQNADLYIVTIGDQRFEIPEAVMAGG